ncbi:hypothetical protein HGO34_00950 [Agrobacterium vitis]|uniref:Uncharacterized protein n=1 Tax=Agrobacterium vitis TaxID=373 RepID=A0AAE4W9F3_AGRVI|nr:hypothetical protein [Agrobacterium vitis]MCF1498601.1 hypothetical protein [Allorhizobium sp. Av2]MCM2438280.1 hypothetical protein [Agrobacterium vitis]MUZ56339.1 hypothetical protein [Agrobacterium vitis]MVA64524.1 hypothetical protein [Agrobacterium vitis]MVA85495.1 hypothetical protein [Agrobacterium vitis]
MPEAVASNSISMSDGQHPFKTDLTAFIDTIQELEALTIMLSSLLSTTGLESQASGISGLFQRQLSDLDQIYKAVKSDLSKPTERAITATEKPKQSNINVQFKLYNHILNLIKIIRIETGEPVYATHEEWPETIQKTIVDLAQSYVDKVLNKMEDKTNEMEAGSLLPWIEAIIRRELLNEKQPAPTTMLRDNFILDSIESGYSTADIAQVLGLSRHAIDKAVYRLKRPIHEANRQQATAN